MKAVTYDRYGPPSVLAVSDVAEPKPANGELLIRVRAAEVTKADCEMRSFRFAVKWFWLPLRLVLGVFKPRRRILGSYFSGEVVSADLSSQSRFKVGQAIFGCTQLRLGAHAEYLTVPSRYTITEKPDSVSFAEAAATPLGALNALHFVDQSGLGEGESILIIGGGGSIGLFAIQIAKARGALVTVVDKTSKADVVREAGADAFIDYSERSYTDENQRYDVVFNMVANEPYGNALGVLTPGGRYLMGNPRLLNMVRSVLTGWFSKRRAYFAFAAETVDQLETLKAMIEEEDLRPLVDQTYPLSAASEAHEKVESEQRNGAIVLTMG